MKGCEYRVRAIWKGADQSRAPHPPLLGKKGALSFGNPPPSPMNTPCTLYHIQEALWEGPEREVGKVPQSLPTKWRHIEVGIIFWGREASSIIYLFVVTAYSLSERILLLGLVNLPIQCRSNPSVYLSIPLSINLWRWDDTELLHHLKTKDLWDTKLGLVYCPIPKVWWSL